MDIILQILSISMTLKYSTLEKCQLLSLHYLLNSQGILTTWLEIADNLKSSDNKPTGKCHIKWFQFFPPPLDLYWNQITNSLPWESLEGYVNAPLNEIPIMQL